MLKVCLVGDGELRVWLGDMLVFITATVVADWVVSFLVPSFNEMCSVTVLK